MGSIDQSHVISTTANEEAGELTKTLYKTEIRATEMACIIGLYRQVKLLRVGTPDLEKMARTLARQACNKLGSLGPPSTGGNSCPLPRSKAGTTTGKISKVNCNGLETKIIHKTEADTDSDVKQGDNQGPGCGREPGLVAKLAGVKEQQTHDMMRRLRADIKVVKRRIKALVPRTRYKDIVISVGESQSQSLDQSCCKTQQEDFVLQDKVGFLL